MNLVRFLLKNRSYSHDRANMRVVIYPPKQWLPGGIRNLARVQPPHK